MVRSLLVALAAALLLLAGCGNDGGDTTIIQTTVADDPATTTTDAATEPDPSPADPEEFTGHCTGGKTPLVPEPGKPGFIDVRVVESPCEFATEVATGFVQAYGPDCFEGCTKTVQGMRCETQPPIHSDVVCFAARTEVRFSIEGND